MFNFFNKKPIYSLSFREYIMNSTNESIKRKIEQNYNCKPNTCKPNTCKPDIKKSNLVTEPFSPDNFKVCTITNILVASLTTFIYYIYFKKSN